LSNLPVSPASGFFYDTMSVYYTYYNVMINQNGVLPSSIPFPAYTNAPLTTLSTRMSASAPWFPLPVLPLSYFYDLQGNLRIYNDGGNGTMPYFIFNFLASGNNIIDGSGTNQQYSMICDYDPVTVNNTQRFFLSNHNANLNMLVQNNGQVLLYPAVYIIELVFDQAYLMQIQKKL
jgi:hypothetical protein